MKLGIETSGFDEIKAKLQGLPGQVSTQVIGKGLLGAAKEVRKEARGSPFLPIRTGNLAQGHRCQVHDDRGADGSRDQAYSWFRGRRRRDAGQEGTSRCVVCSLDRVWVSASWRAGHCRAPVPRERGYQDALKTDSGRPP